ncbi:MAG: agmatine deiminase family protein [Myxococcales bacterium]|jgi:agmatine deiminase
MFVAFGALLPQAALAVPPRLPEPASEDDGTAMSLPVRDHGVIVSRHARPGRRLRGDHEPIDLLMLVHEADWSSSLEAIIERVADTTAVEVLVEDLRRDGPRYQRLARGRCVELTEVAHDTPWIRDYGPLQVFDGDHPVWVDFAYASDRTLDDALPENLASRHESLLDLQTTYLEGGAVVSNGRGLCAMSEMSLLETGVASGDADQLERFAAHMGCAALAVVPALPDEQTGHADVTIQFLDVDRVAVAWMSPDERPLQSELLDQTEQLLREAADLLGQPLEVVRVPMSSHGDVFYSYLNGTRVGDVFLVPSYARDDPAYQQAAYAILEANMPGVTLVPIPADAMVELGGAIHCITLGLNLPRRAPRRCVPGQATRVEPHGTPRRRRAARSPGSARPWRARPSELQPRPGSKLRAL